MLSGKRPKDDLEFKCAVPTPIPDDLASAYSPPHLSLERSEASQGQGNRAQYTAGIDLHKDQALRLASPDIT